MIAGIFHKGSGLGNQLHRYVATRVLALDKGYEFSMIAEDQFKGADFMYLDMGRGNIIDYMIQDRTGKVLPLQHEKTALPLWEEWNKNVYDPDINFVEDNTIIDGNFEDPKYFEHRMGEITDWLETDRVHVLHDTCIIGFRGGEYYTVPELGLPKEYYDRAIAEMLKINPNFKFEVHTDDPELAKKFFPDYPVVQNIEKNWQAVRHARYAIIANSSFYVLPRLMKQYWSNQAITIAPKYWNRYNTKKWDYPQNYYKQFRYI